MKDISLPHIQLILRRTLFYAWIGVLLLYILFPIYWMFISTFKTAINFFNVQYWPESISLAAYRIVLTQEPFRRTIFTSLVVTMSTVVVSLVLGTLAGYAVARLRFRGRRIIRSTVLAMIVVPQIAFLGGLYLLISNPCSIVGLRCPEVSFYNTIWALVGSYPILTLPLTIWFLAAAYKDLPNDVEEAARVDGATLLQSFFYIMLPLAAPALVTTGLLAFITAWNEFLFAVTFTFDETSRTASVQLARFGFVGFGTVLSLAASVILMGPVVVIVMSFAPLITNGLAGLTGGSLPATSPLRLRLDRRGLPRFRLDAPTTTLLLVLLLGALLFVQFGWSVIRFPYPVDYGEGPLLAQTVQLATGENIYRANLATPPFTVANYPPLYMTLLAPFAHFMGLALWYGRLLSWLSMVAAALLIGLILHALTDDRLASLIGGLMLLTIPYVSYWAPLYRIDSLALALSLGGLWVAVRWPERRWGVPLAALLLLAAIYSRQSYGLAAPVAAFAWLWTQRSRKHALLLAGIIVGIGLGLFGLLNLLTGGGFWFNIVVANVNEFQLESLKSYLWELWTLLPLAMIATSLYVLLGWRLRSWRLIAPYLLGAALSALTIGKIGSNVNYLLEYSAALCLASGAVIAWLRQYPLARQAAMVVLAVQMVLLVPGTRYQLFTSLTLDRSDEFVALRRLIDTTNGPILADEDMGMLVLAGRRLELQPFEATQLARAGVWNQQPLLDAIDQHAYSTILILRIPQAELERDRWTPEMLEHIDRSYQQVTQIGNTFVYQPKQP